MLPYLNTDLENYAIEHALLTFEKKNFFDFKYLRENLIEAERIALFYAEANLDFNEKLSSQKNDLSIVLGTKRVMLCF